MATAFGLRARVALDLAAAAVLALAPAAVGGTLLLRAELLSRERAAAALTADLVAARVGACEGADACIERALGEARAAGLDARLEAQAGCAPCTFVTAGPDGGPRLATLRAAGARHLRVESSLAAVGERLTRTVARLVLVLVLSGVLLVAAGTWLFERGPLRGIRRIGEALERVESLEPAAALVPESGDEIGRAGAALRRTTERLREERRRTEAYIEELVRANRALRQTHEGLARSERLATVGRLAAGIAHEVGNPLAAVLGYLDLARRRPAETGEYLARIERETRRIDRIVRDLLDFSRPVARVEGAAPVSAAAAIDAAARLVAPQPRWRSMKLETRVPADLPCVAAREHDLVQVLVNLLINAADACAGRGAVTVSARVEGAAEGAGAEGVVLEVADDGPGFAPEHLSRVFEPFFTTKAPGEGTGLGLAICHRILESFGGSIEAANGEPRGARVTLRFRLAEPAGARPAPGAGTPGA